MNSRCSAIALSCRSPRLSFERTMARIPNHIPTAAMLAATALRIGAARAASRMTSTDDEAREAICTVSIRHPTVSVMAYSAIRSRSDHGADGPATPCDNRNSVRFADMGSLNGDPEIVTHIAVCLGNVKIYVSFWERGRGSAVCLMV